MICKHLLDGLTVIVLLIIFSLCLVMPTSVKTGNSFSKVVGKGVGKRCKISTNLTKTKLND